LPSGAPLGVVLLVTEDGCGVLTSHPYDLQPRTPRSGGLADGKWPMTTLSSWDVADGPGVTALGLAAARAVESNVPDRLIDDRFADAFIDAAPIELPMLRRWPEPGADVSDQEALHLHGSRYIGVRTRFYDDHLLAAAGDVIRQAVILGAGLDTRAYRLEWSPRFHFYEVDQPGVLEFKRAALGGCSAEPRCERRTVGADLRGEWPAALQEAGFDSESRTAWVAEGLLAYHPAEAQQRLLERVHGLSPTASRLALDRIAGELDGDGGARLQRLSARSGIEMDRLMTAEARADIGDWLGSRSWTVEEVATDAVAARYGRDLGDPFRDRAEPAGSAQDAEPPWLDTVFLTARSGDG
jgi:methyltransferase (TIGR00027 family)